MEESFGFLTSLLLSLSVDKWCSVLSIITNVLLYLLLFLFFSKIVITRSIALHHALHGRELLIDRRFALSVIQTAIVVVYDALVVAHLIDAWSIAGFEVVARAKLLAIASILHG